MTRLHRDDTDTGTGALSDCLDYSSVQLGNVFYPGTMGVLRRSPGLEPEPEHEHEHGYDRRGIRGRGSLSYTTLHPSVYQ